MKKIIFASFAFLLFFSFFSFTKAEEKTSVIFFYSETCPHCKEEIKFLDKLEAEYPEFVIMRYEAVANSKNREILKGFYEKYQVPKEHLGRLPIIFTPDKYFIGFNESIGEKIKSCLNECLGGEIGVVSQTLNIPFLGETDLSKMSLPLLAMALGVLDGFNPCAMWIMLFLIVLLINTHSKKKMWLIGGTFIAVSGIVYYLILTAWLNLFLAISYVNITRILIGIFALGVGVWQIKNFITYHPGVCKIVGLRPKLEKKLKNKVERLVSSPLTWATVGGIIFLAFAVNLIEFFCSAGLPAIFTRILTLSQLGSLSYHFYLLLYVFFFMLDDMIVFSIAAITLSRVGFTEKYNYWATLIGGILIFILGLMLIFKPEILMFT